MERPHRVVEAEGRGVGENVHVGLPVGVEIPDVPPVVVAGLARDAVRQEVIDVDPVAREEIRDDVLAEVVARVGVLRVGGDLLIERLRVEDVVAHRDEAVPGVSRDGLRVLRLLLEADHHAVLVNLDDAEAVRGLLGDPYRRDGEHSALRLVEVQHLRHVHLVDVVGAEHADAGGLHLLDEGDVLVDRVSRAVVPALAHPHLRRDGLDEAPGDAAHVPALFEVHVEGLRLELGQDVDLDDVRVDQVVQHEVDEAVAPAVWNSRLASGNCERKETGSLTACKNYCKYS